MVNEVSMFKNYGFSIRKKAKRILGKSISAGKMLKEF